MPYKKCRNKLKHNVKINSNSDTIHAQPRTIELLQTKKDFKNRIFAKPDSKKIGLLIQITWIIVVILICNVFLVSCTDKNSQLTDSPGSELSEEQSIKPVTGDYDKILASGDGIYIVSKYIETYDEARTDYGVLDQNGEWIYELGKSDISRAIDYYHEWVDSSEKNIGFFYLGEGMFFINVRTYIITNDGIVLSGNGDKVGGIQKPAGSYMGWYYNVEENQSFIGPNTYEVDKYKGCYSTTMFNNGFALAVGCSGDGNAFTVRDYSIICKVYKDGTIEEIGTSLDYICGPLSDDLFYYDQYFLNEDGYIIIDLANLNINNIYFPYLSEGLQIPIFNDNMAKIYFKNPAGNIYSAIINTNGEFVEEPVQL